MSFPSSIHLRRMTSGSLRVATSRCRSYQIFVIDLSPIPFCGRKHTANHFASDNIPFGRIGATGILVDNIPDERTFVVGCAGLIFCMVDHVEHHGGSEIIRHRLSLLFDEVDAADCVGEKDNESGADDGSNHG